MGEVIRYISFIVVITLLGFSTLFADTFFQKNASYIIQPVLRDNNYKYWTEIDGSFFCQEDSPETELVQNQLLSKIPGSKANIIYFKKVDLIQCSRYLEKIQAKIQKYRVLIAISLDIDFKSSQLFTDNFKKFNPSEYLNKFKNYSKDTNWVSYIVVDDKDEAMTFNERREFQSGLRDNFPKSFIGFKFSSQIKPTPQMTHPMRETVAWNNFLPKDDDGDFIITDFPVDSFKRTQVFAQSPSAISPNCDGQFI